MKTANAKLAVILVLLAVALAVSCTRSTRVDNQGATRPQTRQVTYEEPKDDSNPLDAENPESSAQWGHDIHYAVPKPGSNAKLLDVKPSATYDLAAIWPSRKHPDRPSSAKVFPSADPTVVLVASNSEILRISAEGKLLKRVRLEFPDSAPPSNIHPIYQIVETDRGYSFCSDYDTAGWNPKSAPQEVLDLGPYNPIIETDLKGKLVRTIPSSFKMQPAKIPARFQSFALRDDGTYMVSEPDRNLVLKIDADGTVMNALGMTFNKRHPFECPQELDYGSWLAPLDATASDFMLVDGHADGMSRTGQWMAELTSNGPEEYYTRRPFDKTVYVTKSNGGFDSPGELVPFPESGVRTTWLDTTVRDAEIVFFVPYTTTFVSVPLIKGEPRVPIMDWPAPEGTVTTVSVKSERTWTHGIILKDGTACIICGWELRFYPGILDPEPSVMTSLATGKPAASYEAAQPRAHEGETSDPFQFCGAHGYGFMDRAGKVVIEPKYDRVEDFHEGLAQVGIDYKYGYLDATGKLVIPAVHVDACSFSEGVAAVWNRDKWGYVDKSGKYVIAAKFSDAYPFSEGLARVAATTGPGLQWGFIDHAGAFAIKPLLADAADFHGGFAGVHIGGKWGFINRAGDIVIKPKYEDVEGFSDGMARVMMNGKYGYVDATGRVAIPADFHDARAFSEGLAAVKVSDGQDLKGKWGYIDKGGKFVVQAQFEWAEPFSDGLGCVTLGGKSGFIDKTGSFVIKPRFRGGRGFDRGLAFVSEDGSWFYIDKTGKRVGP